VTALARPRSNGTSKLQTHPLVREGASHEETRNRQTEKKIWSWAPDGSPTPRQTGRLTVGRKLTSLYIMLSRLVAAKATTALQFQPRLHIQNLCSQVY
jgi:hypothetical protein